LDNDDEVMSVIAHEVGQHQVWTRALQDYSTSNKTLLEIIDGSVPWWGNSLVPESKQPVDVERIQSEALTEPRCL
jgi:hypothetical protein